LVNSLLGGSARPPGTRVDGPAGRIQHGKIAGRSGIG
jgi:hypothetical protein